MRILVVGEGKSELGDEPPGPLAQIVHTLLGEPANCEFTRQTFAGLPKVHAGLPHKGSGNSRKVKVALIKAADEGYDALVLVHDRDRDIKMAREMLEAPDSARTEAPTYRYPPAAVGIAIETFDAWMLADERALSKVLEQTIQTQSDPEKLAGKKDTGRHPKDVMEQLVAQSEAGYAVFWKAYPTIAAEIDIATLERKCPDGFGAFAEKVRDVGVAIGSGDVA